MGKIRVTTIGDEIAELEEKKKKDHKKQIKLEKKSEELAVSNDSNSDESPIDSSEEDVKKTKVKKEKFKVKKNKHSKKYKDIASKVDKSKTYSLDEALELLPNLTISKFDETVELHINLTETNISGQITLPHGTGKTMRVEIVNFGKDEKHALEVIQKIQSGTIDFDILIATPDSMSKLAQVAKVLGPRGLMPNPKNGTISTKPEDVAKSFQGGQINYKSEAKFPILHLTVGKISFGDKKLKENILAYKKSLPNEKIKNITLKSTMSPGIKISV